MFFTFLHKDDVHYPDLSLIIQYPPEDVLYYYYNSHLHIHLDNYIHTRDLVQSGSGSSSSRSWLELWDQLLNGSESINILKFNDFIMTIGPFYYPATNTRFYFTKTLPQPEQILQMQDFLTISNLSITPHIPQEVPDFLKAKKNKKSAKTRDEIIKDIDLCVLSLSELEKQTRHANYLNKLLEHRRGILEQTSIEPPEPDNVPEKPVKATTPIPTGMGQLSALLPWQKSRMQQHASEYNHQMKVYLMRYREYEKSCERYKDFLENWRESGQDFLDTCCQDVTEAEEKLACCQKAQTMYNNIISRSPIHGLYQDIRSLQTFKHYLETGRANDLQDCMNLFEEERHWNDIKASQERIENTIYFMQSNDEGLRFASEHIEQLLYRKEAAASSAVQA